MSELNEQTRRDITEYLLMLADDRLILGHRLSEWCGHGPILEEDIALANIALDLIGQANAFYTLAGAVEGAGRSEDDLAYFREAIDYRNLLICELPRGDFAFTVARQFIFSAYSFYLFEALAGSTHEPLAALAAKSLKEVRYHLRHAHQWILRLGDGTDVSRNKLQAALDEMWMYTGEFFEDDQVSQRLAGPDIAVLPQSIYGAWKEMVHPVIEEATLDLPSSEIYMISGGRKGQHSEHLGYVLSDMQILQRSYPGQKW